MWPLTLTLGNVVLALAGCGCVALGVYGYFVYYAMTAAASSVGGDVSPMVMMVLLVIIAAIGAAFGLLALWGCLALCCQGRCCMATYGSLILVLFAGLWTPYTSTPKGSARTQLCFLSFVFRFGTITHLPHSPLFLNIFLSFFSCSHRRGARSDVCVHGARCLRDRVVLQRDHRVCSFPPCPHLPPPLKPASENPEGAKKRT